MHCGQPTRSKKGSKRGEPCRNARQPWPPNATYELWACYNHLDAETQTLFDRARHHTQRTMPLPEQWRDRVRHRHQGDPLTAQIRADLTHRSTRAREPA